MGDAGLDHKQQQFCASILQALQTIELELEHYYPRNQATDTLFHLCNQPEIRTDTVTGKHTERQRDGIADSQDVEKLLLARITFYENHFLGKEQYMHIHKLSLPKRAMFTFKYMQYMLEQYKRREVIQSQSPHALAETGAATPQQADRSGAPHTLAAIAPGLAGQQALSAPTLRRLLSTEQPPLSFAQQRIWFLHQLEPGSSAYTIAGTIHMQGQLQIAALEQSLNEIIRRHEVLRTSFTEHGPSVVQNIASSAYIALSLIDLGQCSSKERGIEMARLTSMEAGLPFDLQRVPLIRARLLQVEQHEYVLLLAVHHIAFDGWSLGIFLRELAFHYKAFSQGRPSTLPALPIQYADYAQWQRAWLSGEALTKLEHYWRTTLAGANTLSLPTDFPRASGGSSAGATYAFTLPELHPGIHRLARQEQVTLFMVLLAVFQVLIYRWCGQEDFIVGTDIANRTRHETEALIGFFVNLLPLRTRITGRISFQAYLQQVREQVIGAFAHSAIPFEKLIESLHIRREEMHVPLVQVLFVLQNTPLEQVSMPGLRLAVDELRQTRAKFDVAMFVKEQGQGLSGTITYRTTLFTEDTIRRFVGWFTTLLTEIAEHPQASVDTLQFYTQQEREQFQANEEIFNLEKSRKMKLTRRKTLQFHKE